MEKRQYQIEDVKRIDESLNNEGGSTVYVLSTGGGKSVIVTMLLDKWTSNKKRVLVLAHRRRLLDQLESHFTKKGMSVGMMVAKTERNLNADILIASINTATREKRLETIIDQDFDYIVVDEAHRIASDSYANVIKNMQKKNPSIKLLGVTATPTRRDKKLLSDYFSHMVVGIQIEELQQLGYLAKSKTWSRPVKDIDAEVDKNSNDYNRSSLSAYMKHPDRIRMAVDSYEEHVKGKQMLAFCVDREHAVALEKEYLRRGYKSVQILDSTLSQERQQEIISMYENKELDIIISIDILNEGVDLPDTGVVQLNRPTMSLTVYMQQVGRGLRPKSDGSILTILDNAGCSQNFGLIASPKNWSLNPSESPTKPAEKNRIVGRMKNGEFTEDIDNLEDLELVEMSPEEYLDKIINNEEKAEKFNAAIEQEVILRKEKAILELMSKAGLDKMGFKLDNERFKYPDNTSFDITADGGREYRIGVNVQRKTIKIDYTYNNVAFRHGAATQEDMLVDAKLKMDFYQATLKGNTLKEVLTEFVLADARLKDKVDVRAIRKNKASLKEQMKIEALTEYITEGCPAIIFDKFVRYDHAYPAMGYDGDRIVGIKFVKGKVLMNNHISFLMESSSPRESKSVKMTKVLEILDLAGVDVLKLEKPEA